MFRVTIYSIVAYAFFITFSDSSSYFDTQVKAEHSKVNHQFLAFKESRANDSDIESTQALLTRENIVMEACEHGKVCDSTLLASSQ